MKTKEAAKHMIEICQAIISGKQVQAFYRKPYTCDPDWHDIDPDSSIFCDDIEKFRVKPEEKWFYICKKTMKATEIKNYGVSPTLVDSGLFFIVKEQ